jgi:uncharacterized RDD family membrane protein YckC
MGPNSGMYAQNPNIRIDPVLHLPLAPWWKRLVALLIDGFVIGIPTSIVSSILARAVFGTTTTLSNSGYTDTTETSGGRVITVFLVLLIAPLLYYAILNGSRRGQTVGKMALGIAVRDARTGGPIGFWRGVGRWTITLLFEVLLVIPYILDNLTPLWDSRRQAWHDKVVRSIVVDVRP